VNNSVTKRLRVAPSTTTTAQPASIVKAMEGGSGKSMVDSRRRQDRDFARGVDALAPGVRPGTPLP
jgi:hypothetical protein